MAHKILIIDDDLMTIKIIQPYLESHGYVVSSARDGDEGLTKIKAEQPDLIILDVQMPKINGYNFIFELKLLGINNLPIIVLTAKEGMAEIFKVEGVKEYMIKPVQQDALLENIKKYVH